MSNSKAHFLYRKAVSKQLRPFYANWLPSQERKLGDYGTFNKGIFYRKGNIKDLGVSFDVREDSSSDDHTFSEGGTYTMELSGGASVYDIGGASVKITLQNKSSVYFQALDAKTNEIEDKVDVGKQLITGYKENAFMWEKDWVVITEIVAAGRTIAAVTAEKEASFELVANVNVPVESLMTDANVELTFSKTKNVGYQVSGQKMQVLMGLSKIKGWFGNDFGARRLKIAGSEVADQAQEILIFDDFLDEIIE